jgi:hypothetical protein
LLVHGSLVWKIPVLVNLCHVSHDDHARLRIRV